MAARPDLAVALDLARAADALALVDRIGELASWYKVGAMMFVADGPALVRQLKSRGKKVFLDLKWHDIPNTVAGAVRSAGALGCDLATVHLAGGRAMIEAAVKAKDGGPLRLVGVGVLTSLGAGEFGAIVAREVADVGDEQERFVRAVKGLGLDGFVTAVREAPRVRAAAGASALLVAPGIRRADEAADDQRRTATPAEAVKAGVDLLVVGRPVTGAKDPAAVVREIRAEMV